MPDRRSLDIVTPFPVLIADLGGTHARFALVSDSHATEQGFAQVRTREHPDVQSAIQSGVLDQTSLIPRTAILAVAGPTLGEAFKLTNADWVIEPKRIMDQLGFDCVIALNDFEAQALALPDLTEDDWVLIGEQQPPKRGTKLVLGPGTGLGASVLVDSMGMWITVPGEGGHIAIPIESEDDDRLVAHITQGGQHRLGGEQLVSGDGLERLYRSLGALEGTDTPLQKAADITQAALAGEPLAVQSVERFVVYMARVARELALTVMPAGGVFIAGGIAPKILPFIENSEFRSIFEAAYPHEDKLSAFPTVVVTHPRPALSGLGSFARTPGRFMVDVAERMWKTGADV
ncbi:MAG: ROK family protein [Pseudomonadota bacterium]